MPFKPVQLHNLQWQHRLTLTKENPSLKSDSLVNCYISISLPGRVFRSSENLNFDSIPLHRPEPTGLMNGQYSRTNNSAASCCSGTARSNQTHGSVFSFCFFLQLPSVRSLDHIIQDTGSTQWSTFSWGFAGPSGLQTVIPIISAALFVWVALHLVEFDAVQLLKPFVTKLTGVVVVGLWSVFLHVPVQRGALPTLVAANFTPKIGEEKKTKTKQKKNGAKIAQRFHRCSWSLFITYWRGVSPVCVRLWTSRWFLRLNDFPHVSQIKSRTPV